MVSCAAGAREKIPRTFAHRVPLFNKIVLFSLVGFLVCWCVGVLVCGCIDAGSSNATERAWISAARVAVEALYLHFYSPLLASKTVFISSSLLVICPLISRGKLKSELQFQVGTSSCQARTI